MFISMTRKGIFSAQKSNEMSITLKKKFYLVITAVVAFCPIHFLWVCGVRAREGGARGGAGRGWRKRRLAAKSTSLSSLLKLALLKVFFLNAINPELSRFIASQQSVSRALFQCQSNLRCPTRSLDFSSIPSIFKNGTINCQKSL